MRWWLDQITAQSVLLSPSKKEKAQKSSSSRKCVPKNQYGKIWEQSNREETYENKLNTPVLQAVDPTEVKPILVILEIV